MTLVKRLNRILKIDDNQLAEYLEKGYFEIDDKGNPINVKKEDDTKELKKEIKALSDENEKLKEELEKLKSSENPKVKASK